MNNESVQTAAYCVIASRLPNNLRYPEENETIDKDNNRSYRSLGTVKIEGCKSSRTTKHLTYKPYTQLLTRVATRLPMWTPSIHKWRRFWTQWRLGKSHQLGPRLLVASWLWVTGAGKTLKPLMGQRTVFGASYETECCRVNSPLTCENV